ncbi:MAG: outer membrane protein assembly factor BamD [bacterium]
MNKPGLVIGIVASAVGVMLLWASCSHQQDAAGLRQEERLALAEDLAARGKCAKAAVQYERILNEFPRPQVAEAARFGLAKCRMEIGDYDTAVTEFKDFIDGYPKSDRVDDAMYMVARCYLKQSAEVDRDQAKTVEALDELNLLLRKYPDTDVKPAVEEGIREARGKLAEKEYRSGRLYFRMGDYKSAVIYFDYVVSEYGDTPWKERALLDKGEALERQGKRDQAAEIYRLIVGESPATPSGREAAGRLERLGGAGEVGAEGAPES